MKEGGSGFGARSAALVAIVVLLAVAGVVGYLVLTQSSPSVPSESIGQPVSQSILDELAGVSPATLNQVGSGASGVTSPSSLNSLTQVLLSNGKPEVLYIGAEYCPFCAAERWAMIVALDKFGTFTGLQYMESSTTDIYPDTSTFTFVDASYTSNYISFVSVEQLDRNQQPLQTANANETALLEQYDPNLLIPFLDFGNQYALVGSQYLPSALRTGNNGTGSSYNWTQIAPQLNSASTVFAMNIDGATNRLISAICKIDGGQPSSICSQSFAETLSYVINTSGSSGSVQQLLVSESVGVRPLSFVDKHTWYH